MKQKYAWVWAVLLSFAAVYAASLTFVYVEGDDADSIAFHTMGRDRSLHPPYGAYHSMLDFVLGLLPPSEPVLRTVSIGLTSIAVPCMVLLMLGLVFRWLGDLTPVQKLTCTVGTMLAVPEFSYVGLVYIPTYIALPFILGAHLLLKQALGVSGSPVTNGDRIKFGLSALLFAIGGACRWDTIIYGAIIVMDALLATGVQDRESLRPFFRRLPVCVFWGLSALILWLSAVHMTGYGVTGLINVLSEAREMTSSRLKITASTIVGPMSLFTPAFVTVAAAGWILLIRRRNPIAAITIVALLPSLPWLTSGWPKQFIMSVPTLLACACVGMLALWEGIKPPRAALLARVVVGALLVGPWLVGIRGTMGDTAWGPGFEARPYDRASSSGIKLSLGIPEGAAIPTQEGPRSLFGHANTLLGGGWRRFVTQAAAERRSAMQYAIQHRLPFIVLQGDDGYAVTELAGLGFSTRDPKFKRDHQTIDLRRFSDHQGRTLHLLRSQIPLEDLLANPGSIADVARKGGRVRIVVFGYYPSNTRTLYTTAPESLTRLGPNSLVLDLEGLEAALRR